MKTSRSKKDGRKAANRIRRGLKAEPAPVPPVKTTMLKHLDLSTQLVADCEIRRGEDAARGVPGLTTFTGLVARVLDKYRKGEVIL